MLARRHRVNCFVVHDPMELAPPAVGLVEMEDAETGQRRLVDTAKLRSNWSVDGRLRSLRRTGVKASAIGTDEDPFEHLLRHFRRLEQTR